MECEYAVVEFSSDLVRVDTLGQLESAKERSVDPLHDLVATVLALPPFLLLLSTNSQYAILGGNLDVFGSETGKLDLEPDLVVVLLDVDRWREAAAVAREGVVEQPVDLATEPETGAPVVIL